MTARRTDRKLCATPSEVPGHEVAHLLRCPSYFLGWAGGDELFDQLVLADGELGSAGVYHAQSLPGGYPESPSFGSPVGCQVGTHHARVGDISREAQEDEMASQNLSVEDRRMIGRLATAVETMRAKSMPTMADWSAVLYDAQFLPSDSIEKLAWQAEAVVANNR